MNRVDPIAAQVVNAVETRFGLKLQEGLQSMLRKVASELVQQGLARDMADVADRLVRAGDDDPVVKKMQEAASVRETYFFRAPTQLAAVVELVRKYLMVIPNKRTLRIWSAGCATGEEPYTLTMLFRDTFPDVSVQVIATDMNPMALQFAQRGVYSTRALRRGSPALSEWLTPHPDGFEVSELIRRCVSFQVLNLTDEPFAPNLRGFDLVFCRNVLMYIDPQYLPGVVRRLGEAVAPTGALILTPAEFSAAIHAKGFRPLSHGILFHEPARAPTPVEPKAQAPAPVPSPGGTLRVTPSQAKLAPVVPPLDLELLKGRAAADKGNLDEAQRFFLKALSLKPDSAEAFYFLGTVLLAQNQLEPALEKFQRSSFLDRSLPATELALGQLKQRLGQNREAKRHFDRAKKLLDGLKENATVALLEMPVSVARALATPEEEP